MSENGTDLLVDSLMLSDVGTRAKAVAKLITSVMLDKDTMELEYNVKFVNGVSIAIKSELRTNDQRS
jgi:fructose/tagatose bisphosphate aldolase